MSKRAPGPWRIENFYIISSPASGSLTIAKVNDHGDANARLIAAAPDLLEACKLALGGFENNNAIDWNILERAIAKAEGEK